MDNSLIFVGGPSASGKSTFIKSLESQIPYASFYRRKDAFIEVAINIECCLENMFQYVSSEQADKQFLEHCLEYSLTISDIHYALQRNIDYKTSILDKSYVRTFSDAFIESLLKENVNIIMVHLHCSPEVVYQRSIKRFERNERELRSKTLEEVILQYNYERLYWEELANFYNLDSIELDSEHVCADEMANQFLLNEKVKRLIKYINK